MFCINSRTFVCIYIRTSFTATFGDHRVHSFHPVDMLPHTVTRVAQQTNILFYDATEMFVHAARFRFHLRSKTINQPDQNDR